MDTNDVRERMQETARYIATILPPGTGFCLLAFDFGPGGGRMEYVANAQREDIVLAMREFIVKTEAGFAEHLKDHVVERCPTCGQKFGSNQ